MDGVAWMMVMVMMFYDEDYGEMMVGGCDDRDDDDRPAKSLSTTSMWTWNKCDASSEVDLDRVHQDLHHHHHRHQHLHRRRRGSFPLPSCDDPTSSWTMRMHHNQLPLRLLFPFRRCEGIWNPFPLPSDSRPFLPSCCTLLMVGD